MYKSTDMKRLLTLILGLGLAMASWAEEELKMYSHVYLKLHDGNTYEIPIEHGSKMHSYAKGEGTQAYFVVDITGADCFYQFRRDEIAMMKLVEDTIHTYVDYTELDDIHASKIQYKLGELKVHHTLDGELLTIVDVQGKNVFEGRVDSPFALDLSFLPNGVYVARVNEHTLKIRK